MTEKNELRSLVQNKIEDFDVAYLSMSNDRITQFVYSLPEYKNANVVFTYFSMRREIDTRNLVYRSLNDGKTVAMPVVTGPASMEFAIVRDPDTELTNGRFRLLQPSSRAQRITPGTGDIIIVPGLCYDRNGCRLGWGSGYYDGYLADVACFTAGLCRGVLLMDRVPTEAHDVPVRCVVTENEIIRV